MHWITSNWNTLIQSPWREAIIAIVATFCGALIGAERQHHEKPAGIRTMAFVALGSAAFTMISFCFPGQNGDSGRVAAQIVTGIGFLGGGVIMRGQAMVLGATTAATIWVVAAIGMIVGAGYVGAGLGLVVLALTVLVGVGRWERSMKGGGRMAQIVIRFAPDGGKTIIQIERILDEFRVEFQPGKIIQLSEQQRQLTLSYWMPAHRHFEFLSQLAAVPNILELEK